MKTDGMRSPVSGRDAVYAPKLLTCSHRRHCYRGDVSPTIPQRNPWLMMSTMKTHGESPIVRPYGRLKLLSGGVVLAVVGYALLLRGVQVVTHWTGQPMFSWSLIAAGGLCIVFAVIPASWIVKATDSNSKTARHR
jgi:hypothetical protein